MKNQDLVTKVVGSVYGVDVASVNELSMEQEVGGELEKYLRMDTERRTGHFASVVTQKVYAERALVSVANELINTDRLLSGYDDIFEMFERQTKKFFQPIFPSFNNGAASAFGRHFKSAMQYLVDQPGYVSDHGKFLHLTNLIMMKLESSKAEFFVKLRSNTSLQDEFRSTLERYSKAAWQSVMAYNGTIHNGNILHDRIRNVEKQARDYVGDFLELNCKRSKDKSLPADKLYSEYLKLSETSEYPIVGKRDFIREVSLSIPGVVYEKTSRTGMGEFRGISM